MQKLVAFEGNTTASWNLPIVFYTNATAYAPYPVVCRRVAIEIVSRRFRNRERCQKLLAIGREFLF